MKKQNSFKVGDMAEHYQYGLCKIYALEKKYDVVRIEIELTQIISGESIKVYKLVPAETLTPYQIK